jgi:hypothetical protein
MLIVRRADTNNLVVTMSMNRTLNNPFYLFSFQHIASNEFVRFYPTILSSNTRYDLISFVESTTQNLSLVPPAVTFPYLGQYYYSIYEMASSGTTNPLNAYSKLESGRAWLINENDNDEDCYYDEYISDNEIDEKDIYVDDCDAASPTPTPTITSTPTPTTTLTPTPTPTCGTFTTQYLRTRLLGCTNFDLTLFNNSNLTGNANAICDYVVSGTAIGDLGSVFSGTETIATGQHVHTFNLSSILLPEECVSSFTVHSVTPQCPCVNVIIGSLI